MEVIFIYTEDCPDCKRMRSFLEKAIEVSGKNIEIRAFDCETDEAVDLAIEHGIDDLPGCAIGEHKFFGEDGFTYEGILEAVQKLS